MLCDEILLYCTTIYIRCGFFIFKIIIRDIWDDTVQVVGLPCKGIEYWPARKIYGNQREQENNNPEEERN